MLISAKTHCPRCSSVLERQTMTNQMPTHPSNNTIFAVRTCINEHCDYASILSLSFDGRMGLKKADRYLFHMGLLGNSHVITKELLGRTCVPYVTKDKI